MTSNSGAEADGAIIGLREQIISNAIRVFPRILAANKFPSMKSKDFFDIVTVVEFGNHDVTLGSYRAFVVYDDPGKYGPQIAATGPWNISRYLALQGLLAKLEVSLGEMQEFVVDE